MNNSLLLKTSPLVFTKKKSVLVGYDLSLEKDMEESSSLYALPLSSLLLPPDIPPPLKSLEVKGFLPPTGDKKEGGGIYHIQGDMDFGDFSQKKYLAHIKLFDPSLATSFKKKILKVGDYNVKTWREENSLLLYSLRLEKWAMTLLFALAFLISCLGISSSLFLLILIKAEDLALFKALGLTKKTDLTYFFSHRTLSKPFWDWSWSYSWTFSHKLF